MNKEHNFKFLILFSLFAFSNLFACSGFASSIDYNKLATFITILLAFFYYVYTKKIATYGFPIIQALACMGAIYILGLIAINWISSSQLTNFITLFGILFLIEALSLIKWTTKRLYQTGIITAILSNVLIFLLLPGNILSGWNQNSAIYIMPATFFSIASLYCSGESGRFIWITICAFATTYLVLQLENRSSLIAVWAFLLILVVRNVYQNKKIFRIFYLTIIGLNVGFPYLNAKIMQNKFIQNVGLLLESLTEKSADVNGRDQLWQIALERVSENPLWGSLGVRTTYYHNFSMDVLTQFGWIGWLIFFVMLIMVLENSFIEGANYSKYNVFLVGFLMLLFLSTFENALVANGYVTVFVYIFISATISIKRRYWRKNDA